MDDVHTAKSCDLLSLACAVPCQVIDMHGTILYRSGQNGANDILWNDGHVIDYLRSNYFGQRHVYHSPDGLIYLTSPILEAGKVVCSLVAGPVCLGGSNESLIDDRLAHKLHQHERCKKLEQIHNIPVFSPDRIQSLSEMLFLATRRLSDDSFALTDNMTTCTEKTGGSSESFKNLQPSDDFDIDTKASYPIEKECQLLEYVETGDKLGAQEVLNEILGAVFFADGDNPDKILTRVIELVVLLSRAAIRGGADARQIFGQNFSCLSKIQSFRTVDEIAFWLSGILVRFTDQVLDRVVFKHVDMIHKVKSYVKKNYMKRISLETVASHVYLSPAYFSRIFKTATGENFNVYVNSVRIEAAKKYLTDDTSSMVDISLSTGFEDQSYFSKVFKRMTGVTPNKYRESRGVIPSRPFSS